MCEKGEAAVVGVVLLMTRSPGKVDPLGAAAITTPRIRFGKFSFQGPTVDKSCKPQRVAAPGSPEQATNGALVLLGAISEPHLPAGSCAHLAVKRVRRSLSPVPTPRSPNHHIKAGLNVHVIGNQI